MLVADLVDCQALAPGLCAQGGYGKAESLGGFLERQGAIVGDL
jgi:hypothetical protein